LGQLVPPLSVFFLHFFWKRTFGANNGTGTLRTGRPSCHPHNSVKALKDQRTDPNQWPSFILSSSGIGLLMEGLLLTAHQKLRSKLPSLLSITIHMSVQKYESISLNIQYLFSTKFTNKQITDLCCALQKQCWQSMLNVSTSTSNTYHRMELGIVHRAAAAVVTELVQTEVTYLLHHNTHSNINQYLENLLKFMTQLIHTHTHIHNQYTALWILSRTTWVSWYQKKD